MASRILIDANVLHSRTQRDWVLITQDIAPRTLTTLWTEDIMVETLNSIRKKRPNLSGGNIYRVRQRLVAALAEEITEYEAPQDSPCSDPYDRHVHGAALAGRADMLLTCDKGFRNLSESVTDLLPYEIITPDQLLIQLDDSSPELMRKVTRKQWNYWRGIDPSSDLAQRLTAADCPTFAERVSGHLHHL